MATKWSRRGIKFRARELHQENAEAFVGSAAGGRKGGTKAAETAKLRWHRAVRQVGTANVATGIVDSENKIGVSSSSLREKAEGDDLVFASLALATGDLGMVSWGVGYDSQHRPNTIDS